MSLATLVSQFVGAVGLKYRNEETHSVRAVKINNGTFSAPDDGWGQRVYLVVIRKTGIGLITFMVGVNFMEARCIN